MSSKVKRVARFSTGTVDIHPQHAYRGHAPMYWWILTSGRWLTRRPINVYVVEHADGLRTRQQVLALREANPGMRILAAHDPAAAQLLDPVPVR